MSAKHTPGPWSVYAPQFGFSAITEPDGKLIFGLAAGNAKERRGEAECAANARLIAAAPDMLEALERIVKVGIHEIHDWRAVALRMQETALAAIAKATGEAP